ncbi:MAG: response regulator, partial [Myxococcales bacterium]|nr:response regulator [Myxococcales bacterium]
GIAHDFNNILAAILGHASILEAELEAPPHQRRVKAIVDSSRRAAGLVEQMLAYAGKAQTRTGAIVLPKLVTEVVELLSPGLDKKTELLLELDHDTPEIAGDPIQIQQVVMNLITNASEALEGKRGRVWISSGALSPGSLPPERSYLDELARDRPFAYVEVRDEGCGIEAAKLDSIFDPFYTTKPTGHGLGLAAVLGIVRSHGGDIEVESEPGYGTTFRVLLPCPDAEALAEAQAESAAPRPRVRLSTAHDLMQPRLEDQPPKRNLVARNGEPGYVLIVDDEPMVRELAGEVLEAAGYRVLLATDGDEGLRVFRQQAALIDLLVVDRTMPGLDGLELLAEVRKQDPDVPAIISSGYAEDAGSKRLRELGVDAVLHKPWSPRDLVALVRELTPPVI